MNLEKTVNICAIVLLLGLALCAMMVMQHLSWFDMASRSPGMAQRSTIRRSGISSFMAGRTLPSDITSRSAGRSTTTAFSHVIAIGLLRKIVFSSVLMIV